MEFREHKEYAGRGTTGLAATATALGGVGTLGAIVEFLKGWLGSKQVGSCSGCDGAVLASIIPAVSQIFSTIGCGAGGVSKFDFELQNKITEKDMEISFLRGRDAAKNDTLETYGFINSELKQIREKIAAQDVKNAQIEGTFAVLGEQIGSLKNEFMAALCRERDERVCGDNTIVNYVNQTFYSKLVAGVTPTTETTAQTVYNPLPNCGCR